MSHDSKIDFERCLNAARTTPLTRPACTVISAVALLSRSAKIKLTALGPMSERSTSGMSTSRLPGSTKVNDSPISSCAAISRGNSQRRSAPGKRSVGESARSSVMPSFASAGSTRPSSCALRSASEVASDAITHAQVSAAAKVVSAALRAGRRVVDGIMGLSQNFASSKRCIPR